MNIAREKKAEEKKGSKMPCIPIVVEGEQYPEILFETT